MAEPWYLHPPPIGTWVCFDDHGPIDPVPGPPVRSCPHCGRLAYLTVSDRQLGRNYAQDKPTHCLNGHEYTPGKVTHGHQICHATGGHETWWCRVTATCDSVIVWQPHLTDCDHQYRMTPTPTINAPV